MDSDKIASRQEETSDVDANSPIDSGSNHARAFPPSQKQGTSLYSFLFRSFWTGLLLIAGGTIGFCYPIEPTLVFDCDQFIAGIEISDENEKLKQEQADCQNTLRTINLQVDPTRFRKLESRLNSVEEQLSQNTKKLKQIQSRIVEVSQKQIRARFYYQRGFSLLALIAGLWLLIWSFIRRNHSERIPSGE